VPTQDVCKAETLEMHVFGCSCEAPHRWDTSAHCSTDPSLPELREPAVSSVDLAAPDSSGESEGDVCFGPHSQVLLQYNESDDEGERQRLQFHLQRDDLIERLTMGTLNSVHDIPLGTDLDPMNDYRNYWAANKLCIGDNLRRVLLEFNLGCRVIDAENVGKRYADEVSKLKRWDIEGVRKATHFFTSKGIQVIAVSRHRELKSLESERVSVVVDDRTDDIMVLKEAHKHNCPVVSRDNFKEWMSDARLSLELQQWLRKSSLLQVRFSWGANGDFQTDYDLPKPMLLPRAHQEKQGPCDEQGWPCEWCERSVSGVEHWTQNRWGKWVWTCRQCKTGWHP